MLGCGIRPNSEDCMPATRAPAPPRLDAALAAVADALAALNPDDLSPREALEALYRLKLLAAQREG